jgi:hypothetical protein
MINTMARAGSAVAGPYVISRAVLLIEAREVRATIPQRRPVHWPTGRRLLSPHRKRRRLFSRARPATLPINSDEPGNTCACRHEETQGEAKTFIQFSSNMATGGCSVRVPRAASSALKPAHEEW